MRKLTILLTALTLGVGLWAETQSVSYLYPVYNESDVTKGIASWQTGNATATIVESAASVVTWNAGWYVVTGTDVTLSQGAVCNGAVHLILADGAKLTVTGRSLVPGIQVSGDSNSLTIYGQTNQSGQLIANGDVYAAGIGGGRDCSSSNITINGGVVTATGGDFGAGIGGGQNGNGSDITINGGTVNANGGQYTAGIGGGQNGNGSNIIINGGKVTATGRDYGAGIGGGTKSAGSNITINGGVVTATGGDFGAGIGGGDEGVSSNITINGGEVTAIGGTKAAGIGSGFKGDASSNIFVATNYMVKASNNNPPAAVIPNDGTDLANKLAGKQYVTAKPDPLLDVKAAAIAEIDAAIEGKTLFPKEVSYIDFIKSSILEGDEANTINEDKQLGLDYIALHSAKVTAIAEVKTHLGDLAESQAIYKNVGCEAIEGAISANQITEYKETAIGIAHTQWALWNDIYNTGKAKGVKEALGTMGEECDGCTVVEVKKDDKVVTLYAPDEVKYRK